MDVVGHDDEFVNIDAWVMIGKLVPYGLHHLPGIAQPHFGCDDLAQQAFSVLGANGDEIGPRTGIIVPLQADRPAMMESWIVSHAANNLALASLSMSAGRQ